MKFYPNTNRIGTACLLAVCSLFTGCNNNDDEPEVVVPGEFGMITSVINPNGRSRAFYLQRVSVDSTGMIDNSNATELDPQTSAMIHGFDGSLYFSDYRKSELIRWDIDESNNVTRAGEMSFAELNSQGNAAFRDESTAFIGGMSNTIIIFNPSTMEKTGTIDFSAVSKVGDPTDFPVAGGTYAVDAVSEIIVRDNFLYAALMPLSDASSFDPAEIGCSIIIVDLEMLDPNAIGNESAVVERIYDERGSSTGAWGSGGGNPFMQIDENNDLYVLCHNFWANPSLRSYFKPACILKIANGETNFDPDYYFDLESVSAGNGNGIVNFEYYGNGKFLAAVQDPTAVDPDNASSYFQDPIYQWWSFDLNAKSAAIVNETYTRGASAAVSYFENGFGYIPFEADGKNFVMRVDLNTLETKRHFETVGLSQLYNLSE